MAAVFGTAPRFEYGERAATFPGTSWLEHRQRGKPTPQAPKIPEGGPRELRTWKQLETEYYRMKELQQRYTEVAEKVKSFARARDTDRLAFQQQEAVHMATIEDLRQQLRDAEAEYARSEAERMSLANTLQTVTAHRDELVEAHRTEVEALRRSETAATGGHATLQERLERAATECKTLREEQTAGTRLIKRQADTIFDLREELRRREAEVETLRSSASDAEQRADARLRKEAMVADKLAKKAADHEATIAQLEAQLADAWRSGEQLEHDLQEASEALDAGRECSRLQGEEIRVLTELNSRLKAECQETAEGRDRCERENEGLRSRAEAADKLLQECQMCNQDQSAVIELLQAEIVREKNTQAATLDENASLKDEIDRLRAVIRGESECSACKLAALPAPSAANWH